MLKSDLHPPRSGPNSDPILYGVAAVLAELFPPVASHASAGDLSTSPEGDEEADSRDHD